MEKSNVSFFKIIILKFFQIDELLNEIQKDTFFTNKESNSETKLNESVCLDLKQQQLSTSNEVIKLLII